MRVQKQIDHLLAQRASEWVEILNHATEAERAAFIDWLSESKLHVQEFLEITAVDRALDAIDPQRLEDVEGLVAKLSPHITHIGKKTLPAQRRGGWKWIGAMAAALVAVVLATLLHMNFAAPKFSTEVGEQRAITLADSSVVSLNADSIIEVDLRGSNRTVRLLRGEALFKVAHDAARPFFVEARTGRVQVIGTQFNVYDLPEGTRVSVVEGRVKLLPDSSGRPGSASESTLLDAGDEATITLDGRIQRPAQSNIERSLAWRERRLIFDNAPLEDMVREFNRYNPTAPIELDGITPRSHHYDGIFDADDPGSLASLLARERDLVVERKMNKIIIRERR